MRPFFTQKTSAMAGENQCFSPNNSQKNDWEIGQPPSIIDLIFFFSKLLHFCFLMAFPLLALFFHLVIYAIKETVMFWYVAL